MADPRSPIVLLPNEGTLINAAGDRYRFLATRAGTDGTYGLWEAVVPPGGGPPPHLHTREEEGFYIIEGEVVVHVNDQRIVATPGSFINMPKGAIHWFRNESDQRRRCWFWSRRVAWKGCSGRPGMPSATRRVRFRRLPMRKRSGLPTSPPSSASS